MYTVDCAYPVKIIMGFEEPLDSELLSLGYSQSSGSGFGFRDIQFSCNTKTDAKNLVEEIKKLFKKHKVKIGKNLAYAEYYKD